MSPSSEYLKISAYFVNVLFITKLNLDLGLPYSYFKLNAVDNSMCWIAISYRVLPLYMYYLPLFKRNNYLPLYHLFLYYICSSDR